MDEISFFPTMVTLDAIMISTATVWMSLICYVQGVCDYGQQLHIPVNINTIELLVAGFMDEATASIIYPLSAC